MPAASADVNKDSVRIVSRDALDMHALRRLLFFFYSPVIKKHLGKSIISLSDEPQHMKRRFVCVLLCRIPSD